MQKLLMCCFHILLVKFSWIISLHQPLVDKPEIGSQYHSSELMLLSCRGLSEKHITMPHLILTGCVMYWALITWLVSCWVYNLYIIVTCPLCAGWGHCGRCLQRDDQTVDRVPQPISSQKRCWWWYYVTFDLSTLLMSLKCKDIFFLKRPRQ